MNLKGIQLLRKLGLPGPRRESIIKNISDLDLDMLYSDAKRGATILAFDETELINQNPLYEQNVRRYSIDKEEYIDSANELTQQLNGKGVAKANITFVTHQTYIPEDISYSGRVSVHIDRGGFGKLTVEAVKSLRKGCVDFTPDYIYVCPILAGKPFLTKAELLKSEFVLHELLLRRLIKDSLRISGNPNIDFEVYADTNELFYHDMFLDS